MLKAVNTDYLATDAQIITDVQSYMADKKDADFDALAENIAGLNGADENVIQQAVQDAGYAVEPSA